MTAALTLPRASTEITSTEMRILGQYGRGREIADIARAVHMPENDVEDVLRELADGDRQRAAEVIAAMVTERGGTPQPTPAPVVASQPQVPDVAQLVRMVQVPEAPVSPAPIVPADPEPDDEPELEPEPEPELDDAQGDQEPAETPATEAVSAAPVPVVSGPPEAALKRPGGLEELLIWAETHGNSRTVTLAARARTVLTELRQRVDDEQDELRARQAAARRNQLLAKEAELAAQLSEIRNRIRELEGVPAEASATEQPVASARAVRAWAAATGRECNAHGMVPRHLVAAYLAARERGEVQ